MITLSPPLRVDIHYWLGMKGLFAEAGFDKNRVNPFITRWRFSIRNSSGWRPRVMVATLNDHTDSIPLRSHLTGRNLVVCGMGPLLAYSALDKEHEPLWALGCVAQLKPSTLNLALVVNTAGAKKKRFLDLLPLEGAFNKGSNILVTFIKDEEEKLLVATVQRPTYGYAAQYLRAA